MILPNELSIIEWVFGVKTSSHSVAKANYFIYLVRKPVSPGAQLSPLYTIPQKKGYLALGGGREERNLG